MASIFKSAWSTVSAFLSKRRTMDKRVNADGTLLNKTLTWDTETFWVLAKTSVLQSDDPALALSKDVPVLAIRLRKKNSAEEHEFIINDLPKFQYGLERTVTLTKIDDENAPFYIDEFLKHPISEKVLKAVVETVHAIPSPLLVGGAAVAVGAAVAAPGPVSIPAAISATLPISLKSATSPLKSASPNLASMGSSYSLPRYSPSVIVPPKYSLMELSSMKVSDIFETISNSPSGRLVSESLKIQKLPANAQANDRFLGEETFTAHDFDNAKEVMKYEPKRLTRLHIALLAYVIHKMFPAYCLFRRQCYWLACTFINAAKIIDHQLQKREQFNMQDDGELDDMYTPLNLLQADVAGCWRGIRVHGVKMVLLARIVNEFNEQLTAFTEEVKEIKRKLAEAELNKHLVENYRAEEARARAEEARARAGTSGLTKRRV